MAEFCLECWNRLNGTAHTEADMVVDHEELDICEGCGLVRPCVVRERGPVGRLLWQLRQGKRVKGTVE